MAKAANPDLAIDITGDIIADALSINVKCIVSSCPTCKWNIGEAISRRSNEIKVLDFTEIVAAGMGV